MRRTGTAFVWLLTLFVLTGVFAGWMGWLNATHALDLGMGAVALVALWAVVWLPWDLYFSARELAYEQKESEARGVEVTAGDRDVARRMAPRLLAVAVGLHLLGAGTVAGVTYATGGQVGYLFAGFFVLGLVLRPIGAAYQHLRRRLLDLRQRARYPREDVVELRGRLREAELRLAQIADSELPMLSEADARLEKDLETREHAARLREGRYDEKVNTVLLELERSMAKLTEDRELLQGIRAFVRVVRQS